MKKQKPKINQAVVTEIDWENDPKIQEMMAPLKAHWAREENKQSDLSRFASTLNSDPVSNSYEFIEYYYNKYNKDYGDYEFLVLLASRGYEVSAYKTSLFKDWKIAAEKEIEDRSLSSHYDMNTGERKVVKSNILDIWPFPEFWRGSRKESNSIDATMLRVVDHFGISGFDGYWNALKEDLTLSVADRSEGQHLMAQYLFNMCRSELGGNLFYDRIAIIIKLIIYGKDSKVKNFWEYRSWDRDGKQFYNCPYIAAGVMFTIIRMGLEQVYNTIIEESEQFLAASQSSNGGWKATSLHETESIDATAVCIHALALRDRGKYSASLNLASEFLITQQDSWWLWHEDPNPYVSYPYLSVLVLDAIELAKGVDGKLTFRMGPLEGIGLNKNENINYLVNINNNGIMGDVNNFKGGQFGAVGSKAKAENNTFNQANYNFPENYDYGQLTSELGVLKKAMKDEAETPEQFQALTEIAGAEQAASDKDGNTVVQKLLGAGKWTLETAKEIGVGVVVELINKHLKG